MASSTPTQTEEELGQSLVPELRNLPTEEVEAGQTLESGQSTPDTPRYRGGGGGSSRNFTPIDEQSAQVIEQQQKQQEQYIKELQRKEQERQSIIKSGTISGQLANQSGGGASAAELVGVVDVAGQISKDNTNRRYVPGKGFVTEKGYLFTEVEDGLYSGGRSKKESVPDFLNKKGAATIEGLGFTKEKQEVFLETTGKRAAQAQLLIYGLTPDTKFGKVEIGKQYNDFFKGVYKGAGRDILQKPATTGATFVVGGAVGAGAKGVGIGLSKLGPSALKWGNRAAGVAGLSLGGIYAADKGAKIYATKGTEAKGEVVGSALLETSAFGAGFVKGGKSVSIVDDVIVTRGKTQLKTEDIVAPEYFAGQKYPQIKKGQTAGELKSEFYEPVLPGETPGTPRAFTASPGDFAKNTITGGGSSEVPGLFGSGKISPTFFKVTKAESPTKLTSFGDTLTPSRPTSIRLTLRDVEFAPGITSKTKAPTGKYQKGFFQKIKGTGRSAIPFAKSEKELVTAADTPISEVKTDYFVKFNGRRIPIREYTIEGVKPPSTVKGGVKVQTVAEVVSSSSGKSTSGVLNPGVLGGLGASSSGRKTSSSIKGSITSSGVKPSSVIKSSRDYFSGPSSSGKKSSDTSIIGYRVPPPPTPLESYGDSKTPIVPPPTYPRRSSYGGTRKRTPILPPPRKRGINPKPMRRRTQLSRQPFKRIPTLTGAVQFSTRGLTTPKAGALEAIGGVRRVIKKSKKKKFKII